jgi:hypothetical protein
LPPGHTRGNSAAGRISFPGVFIINAGIPAAVREGQAKNMDELVGRLVAELGIDREIAEKSVGIILAFLVKEAPADKMQPLLDAMPGAAEAAAATPSPLFGGIMGVGTQLMGLGLGMGEVQGVARTLLGYAREKLGEDKAGEIIAAIPGLSQFA